MLAAAAGLQYRGDDPRLSRSLDADRFTEFDAHYFPGADMPITRLSEPKNYGLAVSPGRTVLCAELPCAPVTPVWQMTDDAARPGWFASHSSAPACRSRAGRQVVTRRLPQAYPIYTEGYRRAFDTARWMGGEHSTAC